MAAKKTPARPYGLSAEWIEYLEQRSALIAKATQRKGAPMTYGGRPKEGKR